MAHIKNKERQRNFKDKMYNAGLKRIYFWVRNRSSKRTNKEAFVKKVERLVSDLSLNDQNKLFDLIIQIIEGKKEVLKLRKEAKGGKKGRG